MLQFIVIYLLIGAAIYLLFRRSFVKGFRDSPIKRQLHAYTLAGTVLFWPVTVFSALKALVHRILKKRPAEEKAGPPE